MKRTRGEEEGGRHEEEKVEKEAEDKPGGGRKTRRKKNNNIANEGEGGKANYWEMKKKGFLSRLGWNSRFLRMRRTVGYF